MGQHTQTTEPTDVLLETRAVARRLGISPDTLVGWRRRGFGPRFVVMGRLVRYPANAVDTFIAEQTVQPGATHDRGRHAEDTRTLPLPLIDSSMPPNGVGREGE
jgi:predicted DNA-binding transcriptional regulator AlpA